MRGLAWLYSLLFLLVQTHVCDVQLVHEAHRSDTTTERLCAGTKCSHLLDSDAGHRGVHGCCEIVSCHDHAVPEGAVQSLPEPESLGNPVLFCLAAKEVVESWGADWLPLRGSPPSPPPDQFPARAPPSAVRSF